MKHIFDLEQQILSSWNIVEDVKLVCENILEKEMTKDQIANVLLGISELYSMKFQKTFDTFENLAREFHSLQNK